MIEFKPNFILPEMILTVSPHGKRVESIPRLANTFDFNTPGVYANLTFSNITPIPERFHVGDNTLVVFGSPIVDDKIDKKKAARIIAANDTTPLEGLGEINGEFLILKINTKNSDLVIVNDRFTSIPFFYFHDESSRQFIASTYFTSIWNILGDNGKQNIDEEALFEFLWLQRILGTKTYLRNVLYLQDASALALKDWKLSIHRYWDRNYTKTTSKLKENAHLLAELVKKSVKRKSSDAKRFGHFLSGGMDSRTVLCAFDSPPTCFTTAITRNREFQRAAEIAEAKGAKHIGLQLAADHYGEIYRHSTKVVGGMYNYDHGLFYGFNDAVCEHADVCFHGHGFDYMFQGMYIPKEGFKLAGRNLYANRLKKLPDDLAEYFIRNVSYRVKGANILKYIKKRERDRLMEFLKAEVETILAHGKDLSESPNDLWEYLTFHHISRHYSYPNHASIATFVEQRTISFDNDIFDFYLSLPVEHRLNGKIEKLCLKILNPQIAEIWSANTEFPVTASCWTQTAYQLTGALKRRIIPEPRKPEWMERTWPDRTNALRNQPRLIKAVKKLCDSDILETLDFLNITAIREDVPRWIDGENVPELSGDLVQTLLTLGTFLGKNEI